MKKYHLVGRYSPRFVVYYDYRHGQFQEIKTFRCWENAFAHYRRKCNWCERVLEEEKWFNADAHIAYDGKIILRWQDEYQIDDSCEGHCYKCCDKYECSYSPVCKYGQDPFTYCDDELVWLLEHGENQWGYNTVKEFL